MTSKQSHQENSLLEEWPTSDQMNQTNSLLEDWPQTESLRPKRKVTMSEYSEVRLFINSSNGFKKSYSSNDVTMFRAQMSLEASSLQNFLSRFNLPTGRAIHSAFGLGLIKHENMVGLEHLVSDKARHDFVEERKSHSAIVLRAQKLLHEKRTDSDEVASIMLAKVASASSARSVKKAVLRASMSLECEKIDPKSTRSRKVMNRKDSSGSSTSKISNLSLETKNDDVSPEKDGNNGHFRVPSVDSLKVAYVRVAKARGSRANAAFAA